MILFAILVLTGLGVLWALVLGYSAMKLHVYQDSRFEGILKNLPGSNCGSCGFAGCAGYADNILLNGVAINLCNPGGKEVADKLASFLGKESHEMIKKYSVVYCRGKKDITIPKYKYEGIQKCSVVAKMFSGEKECPYGCLGFGDCVLVCPFDAMKMSTEGIPEINKVKCTGCGLCVSACPKKIISLYPATGNVHILCCSTDKGPVVKKYCKVGCIGCGICVKICPKTAIEMKNNLAKIDYTKCNNCGLCVEKCPTKTINKI